jgi:hypothetical protein
LVETTQVTNVGMDFKKKMVQLKQEEEMDAKEKEAANKDGDGKKKKKDKSGDGPSFEEQRKELQKEAEENVAKIKIKEKAELAEVAAKMKADSSKRKALRKAGAPSTKNIDKAEFVKKCVASCCMHGHLIERSLSFVRRGGGGVLLCVPLDLADLLCSAVLALFGCGSQVRGRPQEAGAGCIGTVRQARCGWLRGSQRGGAGAVQAAAGGGHSGCVMSA